MEENANVSTETTQDVTTTTETTSTETTDNSSGSLESQISQALDEADKEAVEPAKTEDTKEPTKEEEPKDNTVECPDKFKNDDGSANLEKILKSYKELESSSSKKEAEWQKERAELLKTQEQLDAIRQGEEERAKQAGYDSYQDMQQVYDVAYLEANEYAKYLQYTDDPEEVRQKLVQYANTPTAELMEEIELEFAPEVNKRVAIAAERKRQEYAVQKQEYENTVKMSTIENVIGKTVDAHPDIFNYKPFQDMFVSALRKYGENFTVEDAEMLIGTMNEMKKLYQAEFEKKTGAKIENDKATDNIAAIGTQSSAPAARQLSNAEIDNMSASDLAKEIRKYI